MPEPISDLMLDVIAGKATASLEVMRSWRVDFAERLASWKHSQHMHRANIDLQDAYRARLAEAYRRSVDNAETILAGLDRRISEVDDDDGR